MVTAKADRLHLRDELIPLPYVRGTVGMAIDGADTAGQPVLHHVRPQPHLDARYTVLVTGGHGFYLLDRLEPWDVIVACRSGMA